jgi:hypothetical protein
MKTALLLVIFSASALAHEGHGAWVTHWHASDTLGFLWVAVGVALWLLRR